MKYFIRLLPLLILIVIISIFYMAGAYDFVSWEVFKEHREEIKSFVAAHPVLAPIVYILIYALITALSVPAAFLVSMVGGFLFPMPLSTLYVVLGATIGAFIIFVIAKTALHEFFERKLLGRFEKMQKGFQEHAVTYLLLLRLVPLFPFWLVNISAAVFNVSSLTFLWTTMIGIIPGAFVYTEAGRGIDRFLDTEGVITLWSLLNPSIIVAFIGIIILAFIPMIVKYWER